MRITIARFVFVLALTMASVPGAAQSIRVDRNHLLQYTNVRHDSTIDGLAQTFIAQDTRLVFAELTIASPDNDEPLWSSAFLEIRRGRPGDGNVVFRSPQINWGSLPQIGQDNGNPLYVIRLSDLGMAPYLPVEFNQLSTR